MSIIRNRPSERIVNGNLVISSEIVMVSDPSFVTRGEGVIIVKKTPYCTITLDHTTTDKVKIKSFSNTRIITKMGRIDDEFDQVQLNPGSCVEFVFCSGDWYITSSDGLKGD
jgi:hypothetical protein